MSRLTATDSAALSTSCAAGNGSPDVSVIDKQFNRVNEQLNQLDKVTGELFRRLGPVLTPIAPGEGGIAGDAKAVPVSPLNERVARVANDIESAVDYLRSLLPRIEV